jgi:NADH:ubiquinone oxidoreductase subunit 3 (subunit A)
VDHAAAVDDPRSGYSRTRLLALPPGLAYWTGGIQPDGQLWNLIERTNMEIILTPPLAFLAYLLLVWILTWVGKKMAGTASPNALKTSIYGSGESAPTTSAAPGYKPFFLIAFFFAVLHLGMLVLGVGSLNLIGCIFIAGLLLALLALVLG